MNAARVPRYLFVYTSLREQIEDMAYPPGSHLPPEPELERLYRVSRTTIRKAVELLADEGFVSIRQGIGTVVLNFKATQRLQYVTSFSETLRDQGFDVTHRLEAVETVLASASECSDLRLSTGSELVWIRRLALANERPIAIMVNYLRPDFAPGIEAKRDRIASLYAFLEREYNITIDGATDFIRASTATEEDSSALGIPVGAPLLIVKRIGFHRDEPVEVAHLRIVADRYEYSVHTRERPPAGYRS